MNTESSRAPFALAVDDNAMVLMQVSEILTDAGFRTLEALDGTEAIKVLERQGEDVVLLFTDVQMPTMDGFELARRTAARWPEIAIVVASGQIRPKPGDLPDGARFIAKPFSADMVHNHLHEILPEGQKPEPLKQKGGRRSD